MGGLQADEGDLLLAEKRADLVEEGLEAPVGLVEALHVRDHLALAHLEGVEGARTP